MATSELYRSVALLKRWCKLTNGSGLGLFGSDSKLSIPVPVSAPRWVISCGSSVTSRAGPSRTPMVWAMLWALLLALAMPFLNASSLHLCGGKARRRVDKYASHAKCHYGVILGWWLYVLQKSLAAIQPANIQWNYFPFAITLEFQHQPVNASLQLHKQLCANQHHSLHVLQYWIQYWESLQ